ncbi:hypothetical protein [Compostibacter hankyongensis]|uniref:hypothetical protein n=1 Tax=Compostibacter hankyongensis TaxID=1007089 RepID=UPI0031E9BA5E
MIVTHFISHIQGYKKKAGKADSQSGNVDRRIDFILDQVPPGGFEIVSEHDPVFRRNMAGDNIREIALNNMPTLFLSGNQMHML